MGMTMTQKILAAHCGEAAVTAGQLINARLDIVLGNDITTPVAINEFNKAGFDSVFDKTRVNIVLDHFVPNKDIKSATQSKQCREFADKYDILNFYDVGQMGVEHALLPEKGIVTAGDCIIGAGSLVTKNTIIPDGSLVMGSPAKIKRNLTWEEKIGIVENSKEYVSVAEEMWKQGVL